MGHIFLGDGEGGLVYDLENPPANGTLTVASGIYPIGNNNVVYLGRADGQPSTIKAANGARPIIVDLDGNPARISIRANTTVEGLWFGGAKFTDASTRVITLGGNCVIKNCTFWGYSQTLTEGAGFPNQYLNNRFVNCGFGSLYHDIYISGGAVGNASTLTGGIHVGGAGYKISLYHDPYGVTINNNFMAGSEAYDLAVQGGYDTVTDNIIWGPTIAQYWNAGACEFSRNIIGPHRAAFTDVSATNTTAGTVFCNGQATFGTDPEDWDDAAITANLGRSTAEIDAAVASLIATFKQAVSQIHSDATIENNFSVLAGALAAWAAS